MDEFLTTFHSILPLDQEIPGALEIVLAMLLSFALITLISFTYKRTYRGTAYSQDYVHTLIILGVVVTVIIMVVRGNPGIAFGMFAAFSIIRFRRSVSQARDIGFIFFSMATGMAVGARQYTLAVLTTFVISALIYELSKHDLFAPRRPSHFLRVRVTHDINYDTAFTPCFDSFLDRHDLLSVESIQAGMMTELRYGVRLKEGQMPGAFVAAIQQVNGNNRVLLTSASADAVRS